VRGSPRWRDAEQDGPEDEHSPGRDPRAPGGLPPRTPARRPLPCPEGRIRPPPARAARSDRSSFLLAAAPGETGRRSRQHPPRKRTQNRDLAHALQGSPRGRVPTTPKPATPRLLWSLGPLSL